MFHLNAFDVQIMGRVLTFDVVTAYGALCGLVFLSGFIVATRMEKRRIVQAGSRSSNS